MALIRVDLPEREGDVVQQHLAAADLHRQPDRLEGDPPGIDVLLQYIADEPEELVADGDDRVLIDRGAGDAHAIDVRAVVALEIDDLERPGWATVQLGVEAGDEHVVDDDVVLGRPADAQDRAGSVVDLAAFAQLARR
jgi:hypothetical protein